MKRNFNQLVLDHEGKAYPDNATIKTIAYAALGSNIPGDDKMSGESKCKLWALAVKIAQATDGIVDLTSEELTLLKDRIGRALFPLVVGAAFQLLEQDYVCEVDV